MPVANMQYGIALARLKHFDRAIAPLQKAVAVHRTMAWATTNWGWRCFETRLKAAAPEFEAAAARAPRWADAPFFAGSRFTPASIGFPDAMMNSTARSVSAPITIAPTCCGGGFFPYRAILSAH